MSRLAIYIYERFSPLQLVPLAALFALAVGVLAPSLSGMSIGWMRILLIAAALFLFLLRLRLLDDIKDHAHDSVHHGDRPAARGVISQRELALAASFVLALECIIALSVSALAFDAFLIVSVYASALFLEALHRDRMRAHFTVYIAVHELLLVPLLAYLCILAGVSVADLARVPQIALIVFLGALFFMLEVARKIRAPEDEGTGQDTYTAQYGIFGASVLLCSTAAFACAALVIVAFSGLAYPIVLCLIAIAAFHLLAHRAFRFVQARGRSEARSLFVYSGLFVAFMLILASVAALV